METYDTIQIIDKMWRYTIEPRKRRHIFAKLQANVQKPLWKEENVVVTELYPHKSSKHKQEK